MSLLSTGSGRAVETKGRTNYLSRDNPRISILDGRGKRERKRRRNAGGEEKERKGRKNKHNLLEKKSSDIWKEAVAPVRRNCTYGESHILSGR